MQELTFHFRQRARAIPKAVPGEAVACCLWSSPVAPLCLAANISEQAVTQISTWFTLRSFNPPWSSGLHYLTWVFFLTLVRHCRLSPAPKTPMVLPISSTFCPHHSLQPNTPCSPLPQLQCYQHYPHPHSTYEMQIRPRQTFGPSYSTGALGSYDTKIHSFCSQIF